MIKILNGVIIISCIFSIQQEDIIAISQMNTSQLYNSELNMKINYNSKQNLSYGMQWWISSNYFINSPLRFHLVISDAGISSLYFLSNFLFPFS